MLTVEIDTPSWRHSQFSAEENEVGLGFATDLIDEIRDISQIQELTIK